MSSMLVGTSGKPVSRSRILATGLATPTWTPLVRRFSLKMSSVIARFPVHPSVNHRRAIAIYRSLVSIPGRLAMTSPPALVR